MKAWLAANPLGQVKLCPGCKRLTEKNGGCTNHHCVLCGYNFCWQCLGPFAACRCHQLSQKLSARAAKRAARQPQVVQSVANDNNNASVAADSYPNLRGPASVSVLPAPRPDNAPPVPYQDWDVVILNARTLLAVEDKGKEELARSAWPRVQQQPARPAPRRKKVNEFKRVNKATTNDPRAWQRVTGRRAAKIV